MFVDVGEGAQSGEELVDSRCGPCPGLRPFKEVLEKALIGWRYHVLWGLEISARQAEGPNTFLECGLEAFAVRPGVAACPPCARRRLGMREY